MAAVKWTTPGSGANIAGTALNSLAANGVSATMLFDNSVARDLYARIVVALGSITPVAGGGVELRYVCRSGGADEDSTASQEPYFRLLAPGAGAKLVIFPMVRIYPFADGFRLVNLSGAALAASGNTLTVIPYSEDVS